MTINELRRWYNSSNKGKVETDKLIVELTSYLVTLDIETLDNILAWALSESIEEAKKESKYWYKDVKGMCVTADFVKVVLSKITRMTWENSNKALWRNIYKGKLEVKHGMVVFNNGSCYGVRYGANESYYCIYK